MLALNLIRRFVVFGGLARRPEKSLESAFLQVSEMSSKSGSAAKRVKTEEGAYLRDETATEQEEKYTPAPEEEIAKEAEASTPAKSSRPVESRVNVKRIRTLNNLQVVRKGAKAVLYWMSRDQRVQDNWALLYAQQIAQENKMELHVCFCLVPKFMDATIRQFGFMLGGLQEVEQELRSLGIPFHLLIGYAKDLIAPFSSKQNFGAVVSDFSPLRVPLGWIKDVSRELTALSIPYWQVDAHNVVPCWEASPKLEYAARTIRPKINSKLPEFLTEFPRVQHQGTPASALPAPIDWVAAKASLEVDRSIEEVAWAIPGAKGGLSTLHTFLSTKLKSYSEQRNDPNLNMTSNLSPWLHFGQISPQRCAIEGRKTGLGRGSIAESFLEELIIRRELADNFCFYNENYDKIEGAPSWAQETLRAHEKDKREYIYTQQQLAEGKTHDDLWNAAQIQMVREGKMHGFLRMYWAKKILEWTPSPQEALRISLYLNDRYELDGRDPNGFVGCMWSVCGVHDQGWAERAVFGKIRYMNYQGCKKKFDVAAFVRKYAADAKPTTALTKMLKSSTSAPASSSSMPKKKSA